MRKRLAVLVPEYRTSAAPGGGLATFADFLLQVINSSDEFSGHLVSVTTNSRDAGSRRLLKPNSWGRQSLRTDRHVGGTLVAQFGANWVEWEPQRYKPRRELTRYLNEFDLVQIVAGSPAIATATCDVRVPVVLKAATMVRWERESMLREQRGFEGLFRSTMARRIATLDERALRIPTQVMAVNRRFERQAHRFGAQNVDFAPPGIDVGLFSPARQQWDDKEQPYILSTGRLNDPRKNIGELLRAYADLRQRRAHPHNLVLAGRGGLRPNEQALLRDLNLQDSVRIISPVSQEQLINLYANCSCFVLASAEEGFGLVVLEAMACGAPVVVTETDGSDILVQPGLTGLVVSQGPELPARFADSVAFLLADPERAGAMGSAARLTVLEKFSLKRAGSRYLAVYRRLLREPA